eukprot:5869619-Alexandrium_andersonii.AAC.1
MVRAKWGAEQPCERIVEQHSMMSPRALVPHASCSEGSSPARVPRVRGLRHGFWGCFPRLRVARCCRGLLGLCRSGLAVGALLFEQGRPSCGACREPLRRAGCSCDGSCRASLPVEELAGVRHLRG